LAVTRSVRFVVGAYEIGCVPAGLPSLFDAYVERASLVDQFAVGEPGLCCVTVRRAAEPWPFLVVAQSLSPAGAGFEPGILLALESGVLFVGAGERLLAYDLGRPRRLWIDSAEVGFWGWAQHRDVVVMSAELELAAWTTAGEKLWTTFVEPPWEYRVEGEVVNLDVMGSVRRFSIRTGPDGDSSGGPPP
jgi:hypothetical protein